MTSTWLDFLSSRGAQVRDGCVADFGAPGEELAAAASGLVIADLSHFGLVALSGEEAQTFLHGQITNDLRALSPAGAVFAAYCSAKGRMLANFLLFRRDDDILLMLPASIREATQKRLSMFILRAKVKARDASAEWVRLGLSGPGASDLLTSVLGIEPPGEIMAVSQADSAFAVKLGDERFDLFLAPAETEAFWNQFAAQARPVGAPAWDWLMVRAGVPVILAQTQDQFVPQMANMDALHGISFQKGCYPGQEIVARTQYLGKQKRRLFLAHVDALAAPGDSLYSQDLPGQAVGMVANAAVAPGGGSDVLAVLQISSYDAGDVRLGAPDGPCLTFMALPYAA